MSILQKGKLNILIDGQFGSTGKGVFASFINSEDIVDLVVSNSSPNAGHTFYVGGIKKITKILPVVGVLNEQVLIYISFGAVINVTTLLAEIKEFGVSSNRLFIHPHTTIIATEDILNEQNGSAVRISSTQNGVGSALANKIRRKAKVAKDIPELSNYIRVFDIETFLGIGHTALMEVPQGLDLSLNSGMYPYCTSREITVQGALTDCGLHPHYLGNVLVSIRTYPIRVGNLAGGYSGPFYCDSKETTWQDLGLPKEYTTNTNRVRRVASFSMVQYSNMLKKLRPTFIFLNFCNYLSKHQLDKLLDNLPEVTFLGFGPTKEDVVYRN